MKMYGHKIVCVSWEDSVGGEKTGWSDVKEIYEYQPALAHSFGLLMREEKTFIIVVPHIAESWDGTEEIDHIDAEIVIPRSQIKKITYLK